MRSVYLKNFVATATMVGLCFLLVTATFETASRTLVTNERKTDVSTCAKEVSKTAAAVASSDSLNSWMLSMTLTTISCSTGKNIFIADATGKIVSCSCSIPYCHHLGMSFSPDTISQLEVLDKYEHIVTLDGLYETEMYTIGVPIESIGSGEHAGYVFVSVPLKSFLSEWSGIRLASLAVAFSLFIVLLIATHLYSKHLARPLDEMASASHKFARGDFSIRVKQSENSTDEIGSLINSFNNMADSLEQADQRRSEFIANVSHELRTPMTTIAGFADGILDGTIPAEDAQKYLISIRDETRRLSRLVSDMLDIAQMRAKSSADPDKRSVFSLSELAVQTLLSFEKRAVSKSLDVNPQLPEVDILVRADKDAITRVIYNLLDNAVKFASEGSCLELRIWKYEEKAYCSVCNQGPTIPPEDIAFIFDRFHKTDRSRSLDKDGVGLGLYFVKQIVNSHDEDIAVRSENGTTEFVFTLPLAD